MPTTFTVFSLGNLADMDTVEGNTQAENASALVGMTFGAAGDALVNDAVTFSAGSTGFSGGTSSAYDQTNSPNETFTIDGGAEQTFDSTAVFNATITYIDGTTATITAVVFQDTSGNTYWAPEFSANTDMAAMEAAAIRSLSLDSLAGNNYSGMTGSRETWDYVTCYVKGTRIMTAKGERPIEEVEAGDTVLTRDNGFQAVRWINHSKAIARGKLAPIRIRQGALGENAPMRDLLVSRQHRMLLRSKIARRMFGIEEILVPAVKLLQLPGVSEEPSLRPVSYYHLMTERHEIIYAEGAPSETLLVGPGAAEAMGPEAVEEVLTLFPELEEEYVEPARPILQNKRLNRFFLRHMKNERAFV